MKKLAIILVFVLINSANAGWNGRWDTKGTDAIIGLSTDPTNPEIAQNTFLIVGYIQSFGCSPVISVLTMKGESIGKPIQQETSKRRKSQLVVTVNNQDFSSETKLTKYTNGAELAMMGSVSLVKALSDPNSSILVKSGNTIILDFSNATNFINANNLARANCY
jgi:hypothetical protein